MFVGHYAAAFALKGKEPKASIVWGLLFYGVYYFVIARKKEHRKSISLVMAIAVLSHWFIDLIVHAPDLPIVYGEPKLGFGLWNYKDWAFIVEALVLLLGWMYYMRKTQAKKTWGKYVAILFVAFLLFVNYVNFYMLPTSEDLVGLTVSALFSFFLLALLAHFMDRGRMVKI